MNDHGLFGAEIILDHLIGYERDDGGRADAGYRGSAGDCVTRAAAILTGLPYREVYRKMADAERRYGSGKRSARNGISKKASPKVFADLGLVKVKIPRGPRPTFTEAHERFGDCIVTTTKHLAAIVDGKLRDTSDIRLYHWTEVTDGVEVSETRERKAMSVWVRG